MNIERLTKLAEWLENGAKHETIIFNMAHGVRLRKLIYHDPEASIACGTSCCIAGATVQFFNDLPRMVKDAEDEGGLYGEGEYSVTFEIKWSEVIGEAQTLLDLNTAQSQDLFEPQNYGHGPTYDFNDPLWAGRVVRKLITEGVVDWWGTREAKDAAPARPEKQV